jgi:hypothetical protein
MKTYRGERTIDGLKVTVNGTPLDEGFDVEVFDDKGFEWSYEGSAPRQLALAILVDHLDDPVKARANVEVFMKKIIANLDNDWALSSDDIEGALR